ncbi:hypothetical protein [Streptomyces sp. MST-110588]|uniref:hypothetical protein n=1 Tax=Streptomyces sp. MST-110588 TaxID=2833628 RepID=UPI001F5C79B1|nr:hypothetical protein [Streptomyces sp. MST-110588]
MQLKRTMAASATIVSVLAASLAAAPTASATTDGCGDLSNGQLCVRGGKLGTTGTYKFTTSYWRGGPANGEVTVKLGTQRKNDDITAYPLWFGSKKTRNGYAELSRSHKLNSDECVRGVMQYKGKTFTTKWRCP